ncbi:helix-turn-helix transcriptional regulator [Listeria booriae]|uniref:helix-turn-helix domain-containing protein n=1 Tax=Listeria booriae TaxID=1552123 RepID=UPI0016244CE3|nr:helix-turn-helix transcriptional regulator [Listeria booriae]MBC1227216.1 helix-turn-helix transcriptional regulator [Listeria booriae]MBC2368400.1 helix-turn-helix transcriptional regulator [Listeria booriae]
MNINKDKVGERIKAIRKSLGYSMETFGKMISDSPRSSVNNWEKGKSIPRKDKLEKIAILGQTTVDNILYGSFQEYVHDLLDQNLNIRVSEPVEEILVSIIEGEKFSYGDDIKILKAAQFFIENMVPVNEEDYMRYEIASGLSELYIGYNMGDEEAMVFMDVDREQAIIYYMPFTFTDMSLSRFLVTLTNPETHSYVTNHLRDFEFEDMPRIVLYDIERVENKIRQIYLKYDWEKGAYVAEVDRDKIELYGVDEYFVRELLKEKLYRELRKQADERK